MGEHPASWEYEWQAILRSLFEHGRYTYKRGRSRFLVRWMADAGIYPSDPRITGAGDYGAQAIVTSIPFSSSALMK
jgi:hypothetical protein